MVPMNLALRDINIESHDVTADDAWIYNSIDALQLKMIDIVIAIDPTLTLYGLVFRDKSKATLVHTEHFLFQYDGLYLKTEDDVDEFRMIWRNFATGWYKRPRRSLTATRELSGAEQAMLLSEFKTDMTAFFETIRHEIPPPKSSEEIHAAFVSISNKLARNGTSGATAIKSPGILSSQLFGLLSPENSHGVPLRDYQQQFIGRDPDIIEKMPDPITPEFMESVRNIRVPVAFRGIQDEYDLQGVDELVKQLKGQVGEKGPSGCVTYVPPSDSFARQMLQLKMHNRPPIAIISSRSDLDNENWINKAYRDVPTGSFVEDHFDPNNPEWGKNLIVRHAPKVRSSNPISAEFVFDPNPTFLFDEPGLKPAGVAPLAFVRTGRVRPKTLTDLVRFTLFVRSHPLYSEKG